MGDLNTDGFQIFMGLGSRLTRVMQRGARLHLRGAVGTAWGVDRGPTSLDVVQHGQIQRRLHSQIRAGLEPFHQAIVVVAGSVETKRIATCRSLPHPQMAPALLELIACTTVAGYGSGANQFSQPLLSVFPLQAAASAVTQAGTTARAGEAFAKLPAFTGGLKADLHLRFSHKRIRLHALEQFTAGFHWEE